MNFTPKAARAIAWIVVPVVFSVFAKATYVVVDARYLPAFFPSVSYWLVAVGVALVCGLFILMVPAEQRGRWDTILYLPAMGGALVVLQAIVSCSSGDCF